MALRRMRVLNVFVGSDFRPEEIRDHVPTFVGEKPGKVQRDIITSCKSFSPRHVNCVLERAVL